MNQVALGLKLRGLHAPTLSASYPRSACLHSWESAQTNTRADICFFPEAWNLVIVTAVVWEYLALRISLQNTLQEWIKAAITLNVPDCGRKVFANNSGRYLKSRWLFLPSFLWRSMSLWMCEWMNDRKIIAFWWIIIHVSYCNLFWVKVCQKLNFWQLTHIQLILYFQLSFSQYQIWISIAYNWLVGFRQEGIS